VIVVDSSAMVDLLLQRPGRAAAVTQRLGEHVGAIFCPHLLDVEVASALRRHVLSGRINGKQLNVAIGQLRLFPLRRFGHELLIARALQLRDNVTPYDGVFLALAEALGAPLLTCDARLARVPGLGVEVLVA